MARHDPRLLLLLQFVNTHAEMIGDHGPERSLAQAFGFAEQCGQDEDSSVKSGDRH
jgi:hypothetical protein